MRKRLICDSETCRHHLTSNSNPSTPIHSYSDYSARTQATRSNYAQIINNFLQFNKFCFFETFKRLFNYPALAAAFTRTQGKHLFDAEQNNNSHSRHRYHMHTRTKERKIRLPRISTLHFSPYTTEDLLRRANGIHTAVQPKIN